MLLPSDIKQLLSLLGGLSYYHKFLPDMARRIRPITALLKKGATFDFTSTILDTVRALLAEDATLPILVSPDWDTVNDKSIPFRVHCDASEAGFGDRLNTPHYLHQSSESHQRDELNSYGTRSWMYRLEYSSSETLLIWRVRSGFQS